MSHFLRSFLPTLAIHVLNGAFALILFFRLVARKALCHTVSDAFLKFKKTWYRFSDVEGTFHIDSEFEDMFYAASPCPEPSQAPRL